MANKMTYSVALETVLNGGVITDEVRERLTALKASVDKKSGAEKKPTAKQTSNELVKVKILAVLEVGKKYTATEIANMLTAQTGEPETNQHVSALLRQMIENDHSIIKTMDGKTAHFSLA